MRQTHLTSPTASESTNSSDNLSLVGMPRTIITRPLLGGASGKVRRRYTVRQKLKLLEECSRLWRSMNLTLHGAALEMGLSPCLLDRWTNQRHRYAASLGTKKAICDGPVGRSGFLLDESRGSP